MKAAGSIDDDDILASADPGIDGIEACRRIRADPATAAFTQM